ncbi:MAG: hypothetical protein PUD53_06110 [Oscillospiraceae bacterium]|nr:hypothetical protein [Oscillospiraceae bacterium]
MKDIRVFYKLFKIWILVADVFFIGVLSVVLVSTFVYKEGFGIALILFFISILFITILEIFLLKYYRNIVISVGFINDCVVINTNKEKYVLPKKYFTRVKEETSNGRTYIFYNDGTQEKKFVYIMRYAFKTRHLNISEMKTQMPYTIFE